MVALKSFPLSDETRRTFSGTMLLDYMQEQKQSFDVLLLGNDSDLSPILEWLLMKELVEITKKNHYQISESGRLATQRFEERYKTLLTYFDVYSFVDLEQGEFAFSRFHEFENKTTWDRFLRDERWEDMRVPVIDHLGGSALELVFCHFVREKRFDTESPGWQLELNLGEFWNEIVVVCESAIRADDLAYDEVRGEDVLNDIVEQGFMVLREMHPGDAEIHSNLQAWYPRHGMQNPDLPPPKPGWETPVWEQIWSL